MPYSEYGFNPFNELTPRPPIVPPVAPSVLTKPISGWGALKATGKGALAALTSRPAAMAGIAIPAAGALASTMAGGSALTGATRPDLFGRALGEGYARYMPTWLGGLPASAVQAGDVAGASDIGGDFGARPSAPIVPASPIAQPSRLPGTWGAMGNPNEYSGSSTVPGEAPGIASNGLPAVDAFTAADIGGARRPVSGTGAFVNNATGAVTNLDTRVNSQVNSPDAEMLARQYAPTVYPDRTQHSPLANFNASTLAYAGEIGAKRQALEREKYGSVYGAKMAEVGRQLTMDQNKMDREAPLKAAEAANANATASISQASLLAGFEHLRKNPDDLEGFGAIVHGRPRTRDAWHPAVNGPMVVKPTDPILMTDTHGAARYVTPTTRATEQTIKDTLATNPGLKGDRAKAIQALRDSGRYTVDGL